MAKFNNFIKEILLQNIMNGFLIGRFQPFHLGHVEAVKFALSNVDYLYIGIGSSNKSNELRNALICPTVDSPTPTVGTLGDSINVKSNSGHHLLNNDAVNQPELPPPTIQIFLTFIKRQSPFQSPSYHKTQS